MKRLASVNTFFYKINPYSVFFKIWNTGLFCKEKEKHPERKFDLFFSTKKVA